MAVIGELAVNVVARTQRFTGGMRRAESSIASFVRRAAAMSAAVGGVTLALRSFSGGVRDAIRHIEELSFAAQKLDIQGETLSGFLLAGRRAGVDQRQFVTAMQRMTRRIAEAAQGTGELAKEFERFGISAKVLSQLPIEEQFRRMADIIGAAQTQSEKIRLSFKAFDSEGVNLVRVLGQGSSSLREFQREAERLGQTVSSEAGMQVREFSDNIARLKELGEGAKNRFVIEVNPLAVRVTDALVQLAENANRPAPPGQFFQQARTDLMRRANTLVTRGPIGMLQSEMMRTPSRTQQFMREGITAAERMTPQQLDDIRRSAANPFDPRKLRPFEDGLQATLRRGFQDFFFNIGRGQGLAFGQLGRGANVAGTGLGGFAARIAKSQIRTAPTAPLAAIEAGTARGFAALRQNLRKEDDESKDLNRQQLDELQKLNGKFDDFFADEFFKTVEIPF